MIPMMKVVMAMLTNNRSGPGKEAWTEKRHGKNAVILDDSGTERLAVAIVKQACDDYEKVLRQMLRKPSPAVLRSLKEEKAEQEQFFLSPWFETLVDIDGRWLMKKLQKNAVDKEKARVEAKLKKAKDKVSKRMKKGG